MKLIFFFLVVFTAFFGMTGGSITITVTGTSATAGASTAGTAATAASTVTLSAAENAALTAAQQAHQAALREASYTAALHRAAIATATDPSVIQTAAAAAAKAAAAERAAAVAVQGLQICMRSGVCTGGAAGTSSATAAVAAAQAATAEAAAASSAASGAATSSSSALSSSLQYVGPAVAIAVTAPTVINDLREGNVAAAAGHTAVAAASYQASVSAAAACVPFFPPFGSIFCAVAAGATTSILGNMAVDAATIPAIPHPTPLAEPIRTPAAPIRTPAAPIRTYTAPIFTPREIATRLTEILNIPPPPQENGDAGNRFQPSQLQVDRLRIEIETGLLPRFNTLTNTQWLEANEGRGQGTDNPLFDGLRIDEIEDQVLRANSIAAEMVRTNDYRVTILDGHGRIIFLILRALRELNPEMVDRARFTIIDITRSVDQWHRLFLPASTTCYEDDFFGDITRLTGIVYVNFCSIGPFASAFVRTIRELSQRGQTVFVSYSTRGITTHGSMRLISESMALHRALATMDRRAREEYPILGNRARRDVHGTTSSAVLTDALRESIADIRDRFTPIGWEIFRRNPDRSRNAHDGRGNFITYVVYPTYAAFSAALPPM